jgi:hypothetical protein
MLAQFEPTKIQKTVISQATDGSRLDEGKNLLVNDPVHDDDDRQQNQIQKKLVSNAELARIDAFCDQTGDGVADEQVGTPRPQEVKDPSFCWAKPKRSW